MRGKVYVVQDNGTKNFNDAHKFGDIVILQRRDIPLFEDTKLIIIEMREKLKDFDPQKDWLLLTGDPLLIGLSTFIVGSTKHHVPCLKWDRQTTQYFPVTFNLAKQGG